MNRIAKLISIVNAHLNPQSRIHALKRFSDSNEACYVKRDDELSFSISGSKLRKYSSLIPYLIEKNYKGAVLIGSAYSNNILGLTQLLIENAIRPVLFLLGDHTQKRQGNLLLTSLLVPDSQIHWINRSDWADVEKKANEYVHSSDQKTIVIPEGATMPQALPGALSLAVDILENETQLEKEFQHVFIEAGTGLMAIAVILAFAWIGKKIKIHVLLLADKENEFMRKLREFQFEFEKLVSDKLNEEILLDQFKLYYPTQAVSFGAVNQAILETIKTIGRAEGFLTDPIYSAKLFYEAKKIIAENLLQGNTLIIHSGGALTLMGFQEQLIKLLG